VLPAARRIQGYPRIGRRMIGTPPTSVHGGTVALLAVAWPLRCGRARTNDPPVLPHLTTDLAHQRTSEKRQDTARSVAAEHSGEVGATPANDSWCTAASHLGRVHAGAYRGDGECAGALGVELKLWCGRRRAAGLAPAMARGGTAAAATARTEGGGRGAGDRMEGGFWGRGSAS